MTEFRFDEYVGGEATGVFSLVEAESLDLALQKMAAVELLDNDDRPLRPVISYRSNTVSWAETEISERYVETCCLEKCHEPATHKRIAGDAGHGSVYFPLCEQHHAATAPLCKGCGEPIIRDWTPQAGLLREYHAGCRPGFGRLKPAPRTCGHAGASFQLEGVLYCERCKHAAWQSYVHRGHADEPPAPRRAGETTGDYFERTGELA